MRLSAGTHDPTPLQWVIESSVCSPRMQQTGTDACNGVELDSAESKFASAWINHPWWGFWYVRVLYQNYVYTEYCLIQCRASNTKVHWMTVISVYLHWLVIKLITCNKSDYLLIMFIRYSGRVRLTTIGFVLQCLLLASDRGVPQLHYLLRRCPSRRDHRALGTWSRGSSKYLHQELLE